MLVPAAQGAAFLPGVEADPPTGSVVVQAPAPEEPLRGTGIQWILAPWRYGGALALDARWLRLEDGRSSGQGSLSAEFDMASYVWQPWFIQLRFGMGLVATDNRDAALTGRAAIQLFPASRFPFELRADVSDSRSGDINLGGEYRSRRISLSQGYRPKMGNDSYQLQIDQSQLQSGAARDTLTTLSATGQRQLGEHTLDGGFNYALNRRNDVDQSTRLTSWTARHGYRPSSSLNVETMATVNEVRLTKLDQESGSEVRQLSTFATWQLPNGKQLAGGPLLAATARWVDSRSLGSGEVARVQAFNASLGASQDLSRTWRLSGSGSVSRLETRGGKVNDSLGANASLTWVPVSNLFGAWRHAPSAATNLGFSRDTEGRERSVAAVQASHSLSRDLPIGQGQMLAFSANQSLGVLDESGSDTLARSLAHGLSLSWQGASEDGNQSQAGVSLSDSLTRGKSDGHFQLVNLQLSHRMQLSRHANWAANITAQGTRNQSSEVDVFTGQTRELGSGWQRFYSGSLHYHDQRAFGVPRLRHTVSLSINSQVLERRSFGDIEAPRERISESVETWLDYAVGRLETRLSARVARVEGRTVAGVQARAQRRF